MLELHRGQGKELYWRDTMQCPTESQYEEMVIESKCKILLYIMVMV